MPPWPPSTIHTLIVLALHQPPVFRAQEPFGGGWGPLYWAVLEKRGAVSDGEDDSASDSD